MSSLRQVWEEKREDSCRHILEAAIICFGKYGYENASIKEIADTAGLANGLITRYFESKENLLSEAYRYATITSYPISDEEITLVERFGVLVRETAGIRDTKPDYFRFFKMMLYTSDLPESFHNMRRKLFINTPIYSLMEKEQKEGRIPETDLYEQFLGFLSIIYLQMDVYRSLSSSLDGGESLFIKAVRLIEQNAREYEIQRVNI